MEEFIKNLITFPCNEKIPAITKWNQLNQKIHHFNGKNYGILCDRNLKQKEIERMINSLFNNMGVYLKEHYHYYIDKDRKKIYNVYLGYKFI